MGDSDNRVCVIIVNYNGGAFLRRCLDALAHQTRAPERIIVVDNGSSDGSDLIAATHPLAGLEMLRLGANRGFAEANNTAVRRAEGARWIALLNPDAYPAADWLEHLLAAARRCPEYRFFGSRLLQASDPSRLDGDGDRYHVCGAVWREGQGAAIAHYGARTREIFAPCAAAALYERAAFLAAGGFDARYFCYLEDVDLGFRLRLLGHRALQVGEAVVLHEGSAITGILSDFSLYHIQRNIVWTWYKNMPTAMLLRYLPQHLLFNLAGVAALARRGKTRVVLRAKWDALKGLAGLRAERRQIQSRRRTDIDSLQTAMARGWLAAYRRDKPLQS